MKNLELLFPDHKYIVYYFDQKEKESIDSFNINNAIQVYFIPFDKITYEQSDSLMNSTKHRLTKRINEIMETNHNLYEGIRYDYNIMAIRVFPSLEGAYIDKLFIEFSNCKL